MTQSLHTFRPQQEKHHHRIVTLWAGLRPDELKRQLNQLDNKVRLAFHNGHKPVKVGRLSVNFTHFPGKKPNHYGFGIKIKTFRSGGGFTISTLASDCASEKAVLIPALLALGVKDPERHVSLFMTIH